MMTEQQLQTQLDDFGSLADRYVSWMNKGEKGNKKLNQSIEMAKIAAILTLNDSIQKLINVNQSIASNTSK